MPVGKFFNLLDKSPDDFLPRPRLTFILRARCASRTSDPIISSSNNFVVFPRFPSTSPILRKNENKDLQSGQDSMHVHVRMYICIYI